MSDKAALAAEKIRTRRDLPYSVGLVLGSGLGGLAEAVSDAIRIPFAALPGFPASGVSSHKGEVVAGRSRRSAATRSSSPTPRGRSAARWAPARSC
jgi:purine-nucleoside phosphorylase